MFDVLGYMANELIWCGQEDPPGINYDDCPTYQECNGRTGDYVYWLQVSPAVSMQPILGNTCTHSQKLKNQFIEMCDFAFSFTSYSS